jgi:YVTN family beta-propeller protein
MIRILISIIFPILLLTNSCFPTGPFTYQPGPVEGEAVILMQPLSQDASILHFTIQNISAIRDDGEVIPLALSLPDIKGANFVGNQRRIASGPLPEGLYKGLSIFIDRAFVLGEEGETALLQPDSPVTVLYPFRAAKMGTLSIFLTCTTAGSVSDGIRFNPSFSMALSDRGPIYNRGYLSSTSTNRIIVFNKKNMQVTGIISTGTAPRGMAIDKRRARIYVAASGDDRIEVIDLLKEEITGRLSLNFMDRPVELALTPDGRMLVSVNEGSNTISIIDAVSLYEIIRIRVGEKPAWVAIDPSGLKAYIINSLANSISVVDLTQKILSSTMVVESTPIRGAFNRSGSELYIVFRDSPSLMVINPRESTVQSRIFIGSGASSIKSDILTGLIMVGRKLGGQISVIDPFSSITIDTYQTDGIVTYMTIDDDENSLYALIPEKKTLRKIDLTSKGLIAAMETDDDPHSVVIISER